MNLRGWHGAAQGGLKARMLFHQWKMSYSYCRWQQKWISTIRNTNDSSLTSCLCPRNHKCRQIHTNVSKNCKAKRSLYINPIVKLQPYLEVQILSESENIFSPSVIEMDKARKLFVDSPKTGHLIKFLKSVVDLKKLPEYRIPEVSFLGKSNVGKSSLIKAMFHQSPDVRVHVSQKPGHTKTLNLFQVAKAFTLVDMPGYGFNMPAHFQDSVEEYLRTRRKLCRSFLLIDAESGVTNSDTIGINMMEEFKIPYVIVLTKIDKASRHLLLKNLLSVLKVRDSSNAHCCFPQPFLVSSMTGEGLAVLQAFIAYVTGNLQVEGL